MKKLICVILALCMLPVYAVSALEEDERMKGVWVATVYNEDYPARPSTSSKSLMSQADAVLDTCEKLGFNTVFLQVRPASDAIYPSEIFPFSKYLTGTQGLAPDNNFDALEYWIKGAHSRGMELHAWVNPYRVTVGSESLESLDKTNPAAVHKDYLFRAENGRWYYDPAIPEVRKLVIDGINEIADNYNVDGIHMDDYFYPAGEVNDEESYKKYNTNNMSKADWRRSNTDTLVEQIGKEMRKRGVTFGISPSGIWANKKSNPIGSDTNGFQSYTDIYADTLKWANMGWIDYIAPQIYWEIGNREADYAKLIKWWSEALWDCATKLYIGIADYKCAEKANDPLWSSAQAVWEQLELNREYEKAEGEIHYNYSTVKNLKKLGDMLTVYNTTNRLPRDVIVYLNGEAMIFDTQPIIVSDRTLVPLRAIFEALGASVDWNGSNQTVTAVSGDTEVRLKLGEAAIYINGVKKSLDVPSQLRNNRTLVPLRAVSEAFGAQVEWDGDKNSVYISTEN